MSGRSYSSEEMIFFSAKYSEFSETLEYLSDKINSGKHFPIWDLETFEGSFKLFYSQFSEILISGCSHAELIFDYVKNLEKCLEREIKLPEDFRKSFEVSEAVKGIEKKTGKKVIISG